MGNKPLPLKRCLDDYIVESLRPAHGDVVRAGIAGDHLIAFFGRDRDVATLTRKDGRAYRAQRLRDGVKDSTIRRELGVLMISLRHAAEEERIQAVPVMKLPPESPPRERWYTEDEIVKLMEHPMSERARNFLYLAIGTGARKTAITTLTVGRVDLVNGFVDYADPRKVVTKKRRPKVKIADWLLPRLKVMCEGKRPDDVVIGLNGDGDVRREVKKLLRAIGIDEVGASCHSLRRTFAVWALLNGAKLAEVSAALGDTIQTTEKNYTTFFPQHTAGAVNAINNPERNS